MTPPPRMHRTADSWTESLDERRVGVAVGPEGVGELVSGDGPTECDGEPSDSPHGFNGVRTASSAVQGELARRTAHGATGSRAP
jgi:hypothetical protein